MTSYTNDLGVGEYDMQTLAALDTIFDRLHPPVTSAVVEIPEWDPDRIYTYRVADTYKGWKKLIDPVDITSDASTAIQSAIDYVASKGGGEVVIGDGLYTISQSIRLASNMALRMSKGATIKLADGANTNIILINNASNVLVEGGVLDGNKANQTNITGSGQKDGIVIKGSGENIVVRNVTIKDTIGWGIFMLGATKILIEGCHLEGITEKGINPETSLVRIVNNYINTTGGGTSFANAIEIDDGAMYVVVEGNIIEGSEGGVSIHSHTDTVSPRYVTVVGNIFKDVGRAVWIAVHLDALDNVQDVIISNNVIKNTIRVEGAISVINNGGTGTRINTGIIITNNTIRDSAGQGIYLANSIQCICKDNWIINSSTKGIEIAGSATRWNIESNVISSAGDVGIYLSGWYHNIIANRIQDCSSHSIYVTGGGYNTISKNYLVSNGGYGVYLAAATESVCEGNVLRHNTSGAIRIASGWLIINNRGFNPQSPSSITVGDSPFTYQNTDPYPVNIIVSGGDTTKIEWSRDGSSWYNLGVTAGKVELGIGEYLRITYTSVAPSVVKVPK